jgi:DNA-binding NarL/FixJ family response regulator
VISLSVVADDPLTAEGATWCLIDGPESCCVAASGPDADVVVVLTSSIDHALTLLAAGADEPRGRSVLVADPPGRADLIKMVRLGLIGFVPRRSATPDAVADAVLAVATGRAALPTEMVRWVIEHTLRSEEDMLRGWGVLPGGLSMRERELARLLAEGFSTPEIGERLSYAERTVKKMIHDLLHRLDVRTRAQAVAHLIKAGAL